MKTGTMNENADPITHRSHSDGFHVGHGCGASENANVGRERRLETGLSLLAFQRFDQSLKHTPYKMSLSFSDGPACVYECVHLCLCVCVHMLACMCVHTQACVCVCVCTVVLCTGVCVCALVYIYIYEPVTKDAPA